MLNDKKIPLIPFLFPNNNFIYKILKKKNELFKEHFSKQCSLTQNRSTITSVFFTPLTRKSLSSLIQNRSTIPSVFTTLTYKSLSLFKFTGNGIECVTNKLDFNKAHIHDMIGIRVIKLCGDSICKISEIIRNISSRMEKT